MLRVCLLLLLAAALAACGARQVKTERKGRIITLTDTILDTGGTDTVRFGRLHSGEIAQLRLWLANETSGPVIIAKYGRSCGCTTLEYDNQPINAGDAQQHDSHRNKRFEDFHLSSSGQELKTHMCRLHSIG